MNEDPINELEHDDQSQDDFDPVYDEHLAADVDKDTSTLDVIAGLPLTLTAAVKAAIMVAIVTALIGRLWHK